MREKKSSFWVRLLIILVPISVLASCTEDEASDSPSPSSINNAEDFAQNCELTSSRSEPQGDTSNVRVEELVTGLTVPWGIAFISETEFLVTERPGRVRRVLNGDLQPEPVLRLDNISALGESGLLGIAAHPNFSENRLFYIYYTARKGGEDVNRVARYRLSQDGSSSTFDRLIVDDIPAERFHDGGRLHFGPDGRLYISTGDAGVPELAQDLSSLSGKILRFTADGNIPADNPFSDSPVFMLGLRNSQGFGWMDASTLVVADHGPSGDLGRRGHDEVSVASAGANLGWPGVWRCEQASGVTRPLLVWEPALPPGGLARFTGELIPEWQGNVLIATLRSENLPRLWFETVDGTTRLAGHETLFDGTYGRLRDVTQAPDGSVLVTTSNCDGRGTCGPERDRILRLTRLE